MLQNGQVNLAKADFRAKSTGNYNNPFVWEAKGKNGLWYGMDQGYGFIPDLGNDVYIDATFGITCTQAQNCKTLWLNTTADIVRINTGIYKLSIWGTLKGYSGSSALGTVAVDSTGVGVAGWISGTLSFTGSKSRTIMGPGSSISANSKSAGWNMEINFLAGTVATHDTAVTRCGNLTVVSGTLDLLPYNAPSNEIRIAGSDYTAQPGDGINAGTFTVKSGARINVNGRLLKNSPTSSANGLANLVVEAGAVFNTTYSLSLFPTIAYSLLGEVWFTQAYAQVFLDKGTNVDSVAITTYSTVRIGGGAFAKTLKNNTTINTLLSFNDAVATLGLGGFSISYGTSADIEYIVSRNIGSELPNSGSGSAICRNLLIGSGKILDLQGRTINIRGSIVGGGSTTNGTLNINQP